MFTDALPEKTRPLLKKIRPILTEKTFYLAGGTGLALQLGHRVSEDLDFFTGSTFETLSLYTSFKAKVDRIHEILSESQTLIVDLEGVKCSFFYYDVPLIFEIILFDELRIADWRDILAEKFKTVAQRGSKKDFYDIYFAIQIKKIPLEESLSIFKRRFHYSGLNFYHVLRSLTYFEDADLEPDPNVLKGYDFAWERVKSFFLENQKELEDLFMKE